MKILRTYLKKIIISLIVYIILRYILLNIIGYSHLINSDYLTLILIFISPLLHIFSYLFLIKKIFKKDILSNIILYLFNNNIYFLYSYLSYHLIYESFYVYQPFFTGNPPEDFILVDAFSSVHFMSKMSFILFITSFFLLILFITIRRKYFK